MTEEEAQEKLAEIASRIKNMSSSSLDDAFWALGKITEAKPELADNVMGVIQIGLQAESIYSHSLNLAYNALGNIVKFRPELADKVFELFQTGLQSDDSDSLRAAYKILGNVAQARPELADKVVDVLYKNQPCYDEHSYTDREYDELVKLHSQTLVLSLAPYLKKHPLDEALAKYPEATTEIKAAQALKFSLSEEIKYALENTSLEKIAETNYGGQHKVLNALVGLRAKEENMSEAEGKKFRQLMNMPAGKESAIGRLYADDKSWLLPASFNGAAVFGAYFPSYIKKTEGYLSTHDAVYWLPKDMGRAKNESFARFVQNNIIYQNAEHKMVARPLNELSIIAKNWKGLKPEETKGSFKDVLAACQAKTYVGQKYEAFAVEAACCGMHEANYGNSESIYQAGLEVPEPFDSSKRYTDAEHPGYTGRFLPRDDVRTGFFGEHTGCCQHFGGVGDSCAVSTIKDPYSQLFVIENEKGEIVAGSWTWENREGKYREVCFDNIEAKGEYAKHPVVNAVYEKVAEDLCKNGNCRRVTAGMGYQDADTSKYAETEKIPLPKDYGNRYSDATGTQVLMAKNPQATPLDKTQESLRFIRDVCFLDEDRMRRISAKCFPDSDKERQIPDNVSGKVAVDYFKGVVGYCLYDKEEKSVYDMAVLPEYRTDKNATSTKLFLAMMKDIQKEGGKWTAEVRDSTTYKWFKIMEARGKVKLAEDGVDHVMGDGSKVYKIRFTLPEAKQQNEQSNTLSKTAQKER